MDTPAPAHGAEERRGALAKRERALAVLANRQHGVISRRQLLSLGLGARTIARRLEAGRLKTLHRGVYAFSPGRIGRRGRWMAAVLACGKGALLSHRSAAALWGLMGTGRGPAEVTAAVGRQRAGIAVHEGGICDADRAAVSNIPVTTVARTLLDLAEVIDERGLEQAFEEADRLQLLEIQVLEQVCARGYGRRGLKPLRRLIDAAGMPETPRSFLEDAFLAFCRAEGLPLPQINVLVLGHEADAYWPGEKLVVEADSWSFHRHRAAFERDRARDAAMQAAGYRVIRVTHRRLEREPRTVAAELRRLLDVQDGRAGA